MAKNLLMVSLVSRWWFYLSLQRVTPGSPSGGHRGQGTPWSITRPDAEGPGGTAGFTPHLGWSSTWRDGSTITGWRCKAGAGKAGLSRGVPAVHRRAVTRRWHSPSAAAPERGRSPPPRQGQRRDSLGQFQETGEKSCLFFLGNALCEILLQ